MARQSEPNERMVCIAAVAAAHGVRGALKLRTFTEVPENVAAYGPVFDENGNGLFDLELIGPTKGGVLARASGIDSREAAEALKGKRLHVPRSRLPEPDEDEFYHEDLLGLEAVDVDGSPMGKVAAVFDFGGGDLIEIVTTAGEKIDLPFSREVVPEIDLQKGRIVVVPPGNYLGGKETGP
jgi:16S rRNA processing protein RimM